MSDNSKTALLIIDVQAGSFAPSAQRGFGGMNPKDQQVYLDQLSEAAEKFRQKGHPVIWVTIGEGSTFIQPQIQSSDIKSPSQLKEMGWFGGPQPESEQTRLLLENFQNFTEKKGPQVRDAAVKKMGFNTFNPKEDGTDGLLAYLNKNGVRNIAIAGGNADVCVTATALGAAKYGYGVTVLSDLLLSDDNAQRTKSPQQYEHEMGQRLDGFQFGAPQTEMHFNQHTLVAEGIDLADANIRHIAQRIETKSSTVFFKSNVSGDMQGYRGAARIRHTSIKGAEPSDAETDGMKPNRRFHHQLFAQMHPR